MHPDGYVELRDRAKDVVVSGGENISTVEVEQAVLAQQPEIARPVDRVLGGPAVKNLLADGGAPAGAEVGFHCTNILPELP